MPAAASPALLTIIMCAAHVGVLMDAFTFATLIKTFEADWGLTKAQQGWVSGIYYVAYVPLVPILMALTDRMDARRIFLTGSLTIAGAAAGFAIFAEGFWSALAFRALSGMGFAAAYMPGLRVLVDRFEGPWEARAIACYTASWSLGTAVSYLVAGIVGETFGWQAAFYAAGAGALIAFALVFICLDAITPKATDAPGRLLDFRPVFRNLKAMGYVCSYAAHTWELLAFRAWLVAFLVFSLAQQSEPMVGWFAEPSRIATLSAIAAMVSSIFGNELAMRFGRVRVITVIQLATGILACALGFLAAQPYLLVAALTVLYALMVQADSGSLTAGLVGVADEGRRGATLAVYQVVGFAGGFTGPILVGIVLGLFDAESLMAWGSAFITMGGVAFVGTILLLALTGRERT